MATDTSDFLRRARLVAGLTQGELAVLADTSQSAIAAYETGAREPSWPVLERITSGRLQPVELTAADWLRVLELVDTYADLRLDAIDGATIAVAERLGLTTVATLDHRDFASVRPAHCDALTLLPAGGQLNE